MKIQALLLLTLAPLLRGQLEPTIVNREAAVSNVPFERILAGRQGAAELAHLLRDDHEPAPQRARRRSRRPTPRTWHSSGCSKSRSLEKHEVDAAGGGWRHVHGSSFNDVFALDAATGKTIWTYTYKPDPAARNCCGQETRGLAILGDKIFLAALDTSVIAHQCQDRQRDLEDAGRRSQAALFHDARSAGDQGQSNRRSCRRRVRHPRVSSPLGTSIQARKSGASTRCPVPANPATKRGAGDSWIHGGGAHLGHRVLRPRN